MRAIFGRAIKEAKPEVVIYGGAAGVDLWAADEARALGVPLWFGKPWSTHEPRKEDAGLYAVLEEDSEKVHVVHEGEFPGNWVYQKRNEWMVDNATHVLAYWDGDPKGGTANCRNYAKKVGKPVRNIWNWPPF